MELSKKYLDFLIHQSIKIHIQNRIMMYKNVEVPLSIN